MREYDGWFELLKEYDVWWIEWMIHIYWMNEWMNEWRVELCFEWKGLNWGSYMLFIELDIFCFYEISEIILIELRIYILRVCMKSFIMGELELVLRIMKLDIEWELV